MASQKAQILSCTAFFATAEQASYASFLEICGALNLNFLFCHLNSVL